MDIDYELVGIPNWIKNVPHEERDYDEMLEIFDELPPCDDVKACREAISTLQDDDGDLLERYVEELEDIIVSSVRDIQESRYQELQ